MTMNATLLDGKALAKKQLEQLHHEIVALPPTPHPPKLVVILVGDDAASQVYVNRKAKTARELGMASDLLIFPANTTEEVLLETVHRLNADPSVHAILIQLPLPPHFDSQKILATVLPSKDVDGFHPENLGKLVTGQWPVASPCTPMGILRLLEAYELPVEGRRAVVIGRSTIVGKPMALMLLNRNATVTVCHSRTENLFAVMREADILVSAVGIPGLVRAEAVKPGAVVIDVGMNRVDGKLVGDVAFQEVADVAGYITPVPGGVGPLTVSTLMSNTMALYRASVG